jgi:hypothetical protein
MQRDIYGEEQETEQKRLEWIEEEEYVRARDKEGSHGCRAGEFVYIFKCSDVFFVLTDDVRH